MDSVRPRVIVPKGFKPIKFTAREKAKIQRVLEAHKDLLEADVAANGGSYSNALGCGNCGDTGPTYTTLYKLAKAFGLTDPLALG